MCCEPRDHPRRRLPQQRELRERSQRFLEALSAIPFLLATKLGLAERLLIGAAAETFRGSAPEFGPPGQVQARCPGEALSGKIRAMGSTRPGWQRASSWSMGLIGALLFATQTACGGLPSATCGMGGLRPQPQVGGQLVYSCSDWPGIKSDLFLLDVSTGAVRRLTSDGAENFEPAWSPDGMQIAFQSTREGRSDLYVMNLENARVRWLTGRAGFNDLPRWSPDGSWLTFNSSRDGIHGPLGIAGFHRDIYEVRPDGSGVHRLTIGSGFTGDAVWSPSGNRLAFGSDRAGAFDLYTMATDGSDVRQLTDHSGGRGFAAYASWSPSGTDLVFNATNERGDRARASIYVIASGGGDASRLTHGDDFRPDWSPNGAWVAFLGNREDHSQLFVVRPDGSDLTQLTTDPTDKDWLRWRPA